MTISEKNIVLFSQGVNLQTWIVLDT